MNLASKKKGLLAWLLTLLIVSGGFGENRVWGFFSQPQAAPGQIEAATPSAIGDFYDASRYDASDYAVAPKGGDGHLVRFGEGPETAEQLAEQAAKAEAAGFPHGVSTRLKDRVSGSDKAHRSAPKSEVEEAFDVQQTGKDPRHHTVVLPKPVTGDVADKFNKTFPPKTGK